MGRSAAAIDWRYFLALDRVVPDLQVLVRELRTLSYCFDGPVQVQQNFRDRLDSPAAEVATLSVARLSDLMEAASEGPTGLGWPSYRLLSPAELQLIALCAAIDTQDHDAAWTHARQLVGDGDVSQAIDAAACFLTAMRDGDQGDAAAETPVRGGATLSAH